MIRLAWTGLLLAWACGELYWFAMRTSKLHPIFDPTDPADARECVQCSKMFHKDWGGSFCPECI